MNESITRAFHHSIFLLMDPSYGEIPTIGGGGCVYTSKSCVAIGTLAETDGPSKISVRNMDTPPAGYIQVFSGSIEIGKQGLSICDVFLTPYLRLNYKPDRGVRAFANRKIEPDDFVIFI